MYHVRMLTGTPGWRKPLTRACVPCSKPWLLSFRWRNVTMIFGELFCLENCLHGKTRLFCDYIFVSWDSFCATGRPNFLCTICCSTISRSLYGFSCITLKVPIPYLLQILTQSSCLLCPIGQKRQLLTQHWVANIVALSLSSSRATGKGPKKPKPSSVLHSFGGT